MQKWPTAHIQASDPPHPNPLPRGEGTGPHPYPLPRGEGTGPHPRPVPHGRGNRTCSPRSIGGVRPRSRSGQSLQEWPTAHIQASDPPHPNPLPRGEGTGLHPRPVPRGEGTGPHPRPVPRGEGTGPHPRPVPHGRGNRTCSPRSIGGVMQRSRSRRSLQKWPTAHIQASDPPHPRIKYGAGSNPLPRGEGIGPHPGPVPHGRGDRTCSPRSIGGVRPRSRSRRSLQKWPTAHIHASDPPHPNPLPRGEGIGPHPDPLPRGEGTGPHPRPVPHGRGDRTCSPRSIGGVRPRSRSWRSLQKWPTAHIHASDPPHPNPLPRGEGTGPHPRPVPRGEGTGLHPRPVPHGRGNRTCSPRSIGGVRPRSRSRRSLQEWPTAHIHASDPPHPNPLPRGEGTGPHLYPLPRGEGIGPHPRPVPHGRGNRTCSPRSIGGVRPRSRSRRPLQKWPTAHIQASDPPHPNPLPRGEGTGPHPDPLPRGEGTGPHPRPVPHGRGNRTCSPRSIGGVRQRSPLRGKGMYRRLLRCSGP